MDKKFCPYCMTKITEGETCPNCKLTDGAYTPKPFHIPPGSVLRDRYLVGKVLGEGGFGITYIGCDIQLEMKVAIKEYYPADRVHRDSSQSLNVGTYVGELERSYEKGKQRFLDEARVMARLTKEPAIVRVQDFFEMNNTAYIVMEYIEGTTLSDLAKQKGGKVPPSELFPMVEPLFRALGMMHEKNLVHRDISPDNIMIESGMVRLLDFGCAREAIDKNETLTIQLKHGYAPVEQYQQKGQGPWTDVYALAATMYFCLTGTKPPQALDRIMTDNLLLPTKLGVGLTDQQERALLRALTVVPNRRTQSMEEFHAELYCTAKPIDAETGSLTVKTAVSGTDVIPDIKFRITLSGSSLDKNGTYGDIELSNGIAQAVVKGGESVLITGVPAGSDYEIECEEPENFTLTSMRPSGTIEKNASLAATFELSAVEKPVGALAISSRVIGADGEDISVRYTVALSGSDFDPNGTYGEVEFKDGTAEITAVGENSIVISDLPAGTSYKVSGENIEDFKLSSSRTSGVIEKDVTKSVRLDYKRIKKRFAKAVKQPELQPVSHTVAIETDDTAESVKETERFDKTIAVDSEDVPQIDGAVSNTIDVPFEHTVDAEAVDAEAETDSEEKAADVKSTDNESEAGGREPGKKPVKKAAKKPKNAEKTDDPKKQEKASKENDKGVKALLVTGILAVGALLILLVLVLFGVIGNGDKGGEVIFSYSAALEYDEADYAHMYVVLERNTDEYRDFLNALNEYGAQVRIEFSAEPSKAELGFEFVMPNLSQYYKASSVKLDGKVLTCSAAELSYIFSECDLRDFSSRLYFKGEFPKNMVKMKLYVVLTGKPQTYSTKKSYADPMSNESEPDPTPNEAEPDLVSLENVDLPEYEIFHYDFTDGHPDDWWEIPEIHGLYQNVEALLFIDAVRAEGAKIVIQTDFADAWQYALVYERWTDSGEYQIDYAIAHSNFSGGEGDIGAETVIDNGGSAVIIIDAGALVSVLESKGADIYTDSLSWVNGAGDGGDTYSISVYAPDPTPNGSESDPAPNESEPDFISFENVDLPEYEIFHYDFTDGHPDDWWENTDVHGLDLFSAEYYLFTDAMRAEGAKIVIRADSADNWQYSMMSYDWWSGNVRVDCNYGNGGEGDMAADAAIATDDGAIIIIDAGEMISIFESKGLVLTNYTNWVNGNGGNTYSISVYAPEPKVEMHEIFRYDFTDGQTDEWWEASDLNSNTPEGIELFNALRVDGAKIVVTNNVTEDYQWAYYLINQTDYGNEFVAVNGHSADILAEGAVKDDNGMTIVFDAGKFMSAFDSKGLNFNNYTEWINGAGNGFNTYSISVYAP